MIVDKVVSDDNVITIKVLTDLTIDIHKEFRAAYIDEPKETEFIIDLTRVGMVDSSVLSLLLLLIDFSNAPQKSITITGCSKSVKKVFDIAYFHKLFIFT